MSQRPQGAKARLQDAHAGLVAWVALFGLVVAAVLAAKGYIGTPERLGAVEARADALEFKNAEQDAALAKIDRDRARMICLLEVIASNGSPLRCER